MSGKVESQRFKDAVKTFRQGYTTVEKVSIYVFVFV